MEYVVELPAAVEVSFEAALVSDVLVEASGDLVFLGYTAAPGNRLVFEAGDWTRWYIREVSP